MNELPESGPARSTVRVTLDASRWEMLPEWVTHLNDDLARACLFPDQFPSTRKLKSGHGRSIWIVPASDHSIVVKIFERRSLSRAVASRFNRTPAVREFRALVRAHRRGAPVPRPIAVGVARGAGRECLLIELIPNARSLHQCWHERVDQADAQTRYRQVRELTTILLAQFLKARDAGFLHSDAHPRNIVLAPTASGEQSFFVDVQGSTIRSKPLNRREMELYLVHLNQYFHRVTTRSERLRFLKHFVVYVMRTPSDAASVELRRWIAQLVPRIRAHGKALARRRDRRLKGDGRYFAGIQLPGGWCGTVCLELERRHVFAEPHVPDSSPEQWQAILHDRLGLGENAGVADSYRIEWFRANGPLEQLKWKLFGSPARQRFLECHRNRHRDHKADLILGYVEQAGLMTIKRAATIHPSPAVNTMPDELQCRT